MKLHAFIAAALCLVALHAPVAHCAAAPDPRVAEARELLDSWNGRPAPLFRAKELLDAALAHDAANVEAMKEQARLTLMSGYINDSRRTYRGHKYSISNYRPGTTEKAEALLREAVRIQPRFAGGYVLLGYVYTQQEKPQEAAAALRKAEEIGTDDPWLHLNWAFLHDTRGETGASVQRWKRVLEQGTTNSKARNAAYGYLIDHLRTEGKPDEAIALWRQQLAQSPDAWGHGNLADLLQSLGRYEEAIAEARKALRIMDYGVGRRILAVALYSRWGELWEAGRKAEAQPYFDEAQGILPDLVYVMWVVGQEGVAKGLIRTLVKEKNVTINASSSSGSTALLNAVNKNNTAAVKFLLELGANPNIADSKQWTPLLSAADEGNEANVKILLAAGADPKATIQGATADIVAESKGHFALAKLIREQGRKG